MASKMKFDNAMSVCDYLRGCPQYDYENYGSSESYALRIDRWLEKSCVFKNSFIFNSNKLCIIRHKRILFPNGDLVVNVYDIGFNQYFIELRTPWL